jgi:hypothetical protein
MNSLTLIGPVRSEPVEHHHLPFGERGSQEVLYVSLEGFGVVAPSMVIEVPITPSRVIEAMSVVFLPRLRGTLP